jgi:uncharacterized protein CbrC (UPF0167 family)
MGLFGLFKKNGNGTEMPDTGGALPKFKYNLDPGIIKSKKKCPVCGKATGYDCLVSPVGDCDEEDIQGVCPWCVFDGSAAKKYNAEFNETDAKPDEATATAIDEIKRRTPTVFTPQGNFVWETHCGDFYVYLKQVVWDDIVKMGIVEEIEEDLKADGCGFLQFQTLTEIKEQLCKGSSLEGWLFRCSKCGKYHLYLDVD